MRPALSYAQPHLPVSWQDFPAGEQIKTAIEQHLEPWWPRVFGFHLLKLGNLSGEIQSHACPIGHQVHLAVEHPAVGIVAEPDELPIAVNSIDACLLSHVLEYSQDPHHILRECHRVLLPSGYLIISGFNPFSLTGLSQLMPWHSKQLPWSGRFFSPARVCDWLQLLGFEVVNEQRFLLSRLQHAEPQPGRVQQWLEPKLGGIGSVYVLIARKRVLPLTPIKIKWRPRPQFAPTVKGVGVRQQLPKA